MGDGELPSFTQTWTNINTLVDSDGDGISDYNERILGTDSTSINEIPTTVIEVAFTVGSSAEESEYGDDGVLDDIAHHIAVANKTFKDSGLAVELKNIGVYSVGDDSDLDGSAVIDAIADREGIFNDLDATLERKPDLIIHYSTTSVIDTGGIATLQGTQNDGVIDYKHLYSRGRNNGTVGIDNPSYTLVHEIGHLMGLTHSRRQVETASSGTFPWSLGHGVDDEFTTIMGYIASFNADRIGFFSSPDLLCGSNERACGVERSDLINGADAVKSLQTTAFQISNISNGAAPILEILGDNPAQILTIDLASELQAKAIDPEDGDISLSITYELVSDNNNYDESRWFKLLLWIFCILLLCALFYKGCEVDKRNQANLPSVSYVDNGGIGDANGENENTESDSSNIGDKAAIVDTITKKNNPTECVIILGAYQSARNAMKMSTKISQLGYTPYEEYFDTMDVTRVGFKFDCREKDLSDFMHEVRKEIVQDAWYLVPRITVK